MDLNPAQWPLMLSGTRAPEGQLEVVAPYDLAPIASVSTANLSHVDDALKVASELARKRAHWLPLHRRIEILERTAHLMATHHEQLSLEAAREGGKPLLDSQHEVTRAIDGVKLAAEHIRAEHGDVIPMGTSAASAGRVAFTQKEPIGVVVAVSAFNHPLNLIVHQVAAALAAGCPVIVKPANDTPLSCLRFVRLLREAGLPEDWCQVVVAESVEVAEALVTDARVAFFSFIGSAKVGWYLRSKLSAGTRCALEHGGVAPVILNHDAQLELARDSILKGGFYHAGQVCVSVQRVFVPDVQAGDFAAELAAHAAQLVVGDPVALDTQVGPLIRPGEVVRVKQWVDESADSVVDGGALLSETLMQPTVLLNPARDAKVSHLEIFGPVVCVYGYADIAEAIAQANELPFAFQSSVFTEDIDTALSVFRQLDASAVMVNDHTAFRVDGMPFAGLRQSGYGVGGIGHTIDDMQVNKMLVIKSEAL